jgi:Transposase
MAVGSGAALICRGNPRPVSAEQTVTSGRPQGPRWRSGRSAPPVHGHERGVLQGGGHCHRRTSATTASTWSQWPSRRWTTCGARNCAASPRRWPKRCWARTPRRAQPAVGMRKNPAGWTAAQTTAMHWLQRSALKSARAWRLRMALRESLCTRSAAQQRRAGRGRVGGLDKLGQALSAGAVKKLATTIKERFEAVVRGMLDHRSNAFHRVDEWAASTGQALPAATAQPRTSSPSTICACHA